MMMFETKLREKTFNKNPVEDLQDWLWPLLDHGSWGAENDGPLGDWLNNHQHKWFNHIKRFGTAVQAGGNMGMYPRLLAERFERVYTFEPHPLSFHCLVQNCQTENIVKINGALGPEASFIENMFTIQGADNMGMNTVSKSETGRNIIPLFALDSFNLPHCDLIALDIEGFEYNALCGMMRTIIEHRPVLIIENGRSEVIVDFLQKIDYSPVDQSVSDTIFTSNI